MKVLIILLFGLLNSCSVKNDLSSQKTIDTTNANKKCKIVGYSNFSKISDWCYSHDSSNSKKIGIANEFGMDLEIGEAMAKIIDSTLHCWKFRKSNWSDIEPSILFEDTSNIYENIQIAESYLMRKDFLIHRKTNCKNPNTISIIRDKHNSNLHRIILRCDDFTFYYQVDSNMAITYISRFGKPPIY